VYARKRGRWVPQFFKGGGKDCFTTVTNGKNAGENCADCRTGNVLRKSAGRERRRGKGNLCFFGGGREDGREKRDLYPTKGSIQESGWPHVKGKDHRQGVRGQTFAKRGFKKTKEGGKIRGKGKALRFKPFGGRRIPARRTVAVIGRRRNGEVNSKRGKGVHRLSFGGQQCNAGGSPDASLIEKIQPLQLRRGGKGKNFCGASWKEEQNGGGGKELAPPKGCEKNWSGGKGRRKRAPSRGGRKKEKLRSYG